MPFLRVLRDKRGYETTYLMHWFRDGHRQRSKILYVFRTPPGVRVGRQIFDPAVMRELEQLHPDIEFEWRTLMDNQQVVETAPEPRRPRKRRRDEGGAEAPRAERPALEPVAAAAPTREPAPAVDEPAPELEGAAPAGVPAPPRVPVPTRVEGTTPEEQVTWLRGWYERIRERIPHRTHDPARRDALYALAERLNPATWEGDEAIAQGVHDAAEALERFSKVFAKKRRRSRRGPRGGTAGGGPAES